MCGIAGIISNKPLDNMLSLLKKMSDAIAHRGPDGEGQWANESKTLGLAHRRLSILDVSEQGFQPMHYQKRYSITYNGEIYNYLELKAALQKKGYQFNNQTDTEVLLALYAEYGSESLQKIDGMFAFAIYDRQEQKLFGARDRFGEKPFYYYKQKETFYFGSEMKALWAAGVPKEENPTMQYNYLAYGFLKNPEDLSQTFFKNILELKPGYFLEYDVPSGVFKTEAYYPGISPDFEGSPAETQAKLKELFCTALNRRLRSDVPVGCSLSGGLDSSLVATYVKAQLGNNKELKTFSAVFPGFAKDESHYIKQTATKINAHSFTCTPSLAEYKADKEKFLWHQEEPVLDESPYILYKVYELAKKNGIKVLLDGQGADEIFAGYHAYYFTFLKELKSKNNRLYKSEFEAFRTLVKLGVVNDYAFFRRQNLLALLFGERLADIRIWKQKLDQWKGAKVDHNLFKAEHKHSFRKKYVHHSLQDHLQYDAHQGKLQTLLRYADRSSMAHGVEIRLPYLSPDLEDFVYWLPPEMKIKEGWTKWILRETFQSHLAEEVVWRRDKVGAEGELK